MIVTNFVVGYLVLSVVSLAICLPASGVAVLVARRWRPEMTTDEQTRLETRAYLVITLLCLGFFIRVFMIPGWFLTLGSLVPHIPGAMCMAGVHEMDSPISYLDTALKFVIPLAYIYWLLLDAADRRIESQPFMRTKLILVAPLAALMLFESALDLHFLRQVEPSVVRCCTSIFDVPKSAAIQGLRDSSAAWAPLFALCLGATLVLSLVARRPGGWLLRAAIAASSAGALGFLVLALHTRVSPVMLEAPYHQCIFCLWQEVPDVAAASGAAVVGLWLVFVHASLPSLAQSPAAQALADRWRRLAIVLFSAGTLELAIRHWGKLAGWW